MNAISTASHKWYKTYFDYFLQEHLKKIVFTKSSEAREQFIGTIMDGVKIFC